MRQNVATMFEMKRTVFIFLQRNFMKRLLLLIFLIGTIHASAQNPLDKEDTDTLAQVDKMIQDFQFEKALSLLTNTDSVDINVLSRRAHCYFRLGNYLMAIQDYSAILETDSTHRSTLFQLAQLYGRNNQFNESEKCFLKLLELDSTNSFYHKQYGTLASQAGDKITALIEFQQTVKYNPVDVEGYIQLGNTLLELEQHWIADSILTEATLRIRSPQLRLLLAKAQFEQEKYKACIETTLALTQRDTVPVYARLLGISYFELEEYDKVIPYMEYLLKQNFNAEWIYYYMGVSYRETNRPDSAVIFLEKAIDAGISENLHSYYSQLASTYEEQDDHKNAIKFYKAAYETSKANILLYHLARNYDVYYKDKSSAIAYYKKYLNSDDTIKIAKEYSRYRLHQLEIY